LESSLWDLIEQFRSSKYHKDVVWSIFSVIHAPFDLRKIVSSPVDEFRVEFPTFLEKHTKIGNETITPLLSKITHCRELQRALAKTFARNPNPKLIFEALINIPGTDISICSTFLHLGFSGDFMVVSDEVWTSLQELLPSHVEQIERPHDYPSYIQFQHLSEALMQCYGFDSMAELHEFLWYGKKTNWKF